MTLTPSPIPGGRFTAAAGLLLAGVVAAVALVPLATDAQAAATPVPLGTAASFAVLAGAGVTNTGPTTIAGDLGTFPTTTITGTSSLTILGVNHGGDAVTQGAKSDLDIAYNDAAGQGPAALITSDLGGQTLVGGVYRSATSLALTGALTLDAGGDPNALFVFQTGSTLTTASASSVNLIGGAQSCRVFWQVGSSATLGTASAFRGTILALADITLTTNATVDGRVLARGGAVTMDTNTVGPSSCLAAPAPTTSPTPAPSATTSPVPTTSATTSPAPTTAATTTPAPTSPAATSSATPSPTPVPADTTASPDAPSPAGGADPDASAPADATDGRAPLRGRARTGDQVTRVPVGAVQAGDGSAGRSLSDSAGRTLDDPAGSRLLLGGLLLTGMGGASLVVTRRRRPTV